VSQPYLITDSDGDWVADGAKAQLETRFADAEWHYGAALKRDPRDVVALQNLAVLYAQAGKLPEALLAIERAHLLDPRHGLVYRNWALMALEGGQIDTALEVAREGFRRVPQKETRLALALASGAAGLLEESLAHYRALSAEDPSDVVSSGNCCFLQTLLDATPAEFLEQRTAWYAANRFTGPKRPHHKPLNRPLRVGYVSGDFKLHSAAMIFGAVVLHHERGAPYLYSNAPHDSACEVARRFQALPWRDISALSDEQAEALIREDRIDILVDLSGHTSGGRLSLFTRKPAPIQVTAWGFVVGTGVPEIDYFLACPVTVPEDEKRFYAERILYLPCTMTYDPPEHYRIRESSPPPCLLRGHVTLGCYSRAEKLSEACLRAFGEILKAVPESRLRFKDPAFRRPHTVRRVTERVGVDRLDFLTTSSHREHIEAYAECDLVLDAFPHGGGVAALECLYAGVPLVTLYGRNPAGRLAAGALTAMGRPEWIARGQEEYVHKAVALANDLETLHAVRRTLRQELLGSPVVKGYVGAVEEAYERMASEYET
jgi:protein O-GlcNAc transferase